MLIFSSKPKSVNGFTLVEILVVMLVIGLSLGMVSRIDYSTGPQKLKNDATQFANTAALILEEAALTGDYWGIDFFVAGNDAGDLYGYRWLHRQKEVWQEDMPVGMDDFPVSQELDSNYVVQLEIEGLSLELEKKVNLTNADGIPEDFAPDIWLYPNHEATAFSAAFGIIDSDRLTERVIVESDILGRIQLLTTDGEL